MNKQEQFINLKEQNKEGVKAFCCLLAVIAICAIGVSLIILFSDKIDAFLIKLTF